MISIGEVSNTFWEINDLISSDNAKVYFSGAGDFEMEDGYREEMEPLQTKQVNMRNYYWDQVRVQVE